MLHGGSSIEIADLAQLGEVGVSKVNFGSSVFRAFFENLVDRDELQAVNGAKDSATVRRLMQQDWESLERDPEQIEYEFEAFIQFVDDRFLKPLNTGAANCETVSNCSTFYRSLTR